MSNFISFVLSYRKMPNSIGRGPFCFDFSEWPKKNLENTVLMDLLG